MYPHGYVPELQNTLYNSKHAPSQWNITLSNSLIQHELIRPRTQLCLFFFIRKNQDDTRVAIVYVDDLLLMHSNPDTSFNKRWDDRCECRKYLSWNEHHLWLRIRRYACRTVPQHWGDTRWFLNGRLQNNIVMHAYFLRHRETSTVSICRPSGVCKTLQKVKMLEPIDKQATRGKLLKLL